MIVKHTLVWGGQFNGKTVREVELEPPASSAILLLDQYREAPVTFIKELLASSTRSIGGHRVERDIADRFWRTVKFPDCQFALIKLVSPNWPEEESVMQPCICLRGHVSQVKVSLAEFKIADDVSKDFSVTFSPFEAEPGRIITRIDGEIASIEQEETLQGYTKEERHNEGMLRRIAMTCKAPEHPDFAFALGHVFKLPAPARKKISLAIYSKQVLDLTIRGNCNQCPLPAEGVLNIVDFL